MSFVLCLLIVAAYFCLLEVNCRSVQIDSDARTRFEFKENKDLHHDSESGGKFSWKRLKPILRREVQRIRNVKGEASKVNLDSIESTSSIPSKEKENLLNLSEENNTDIALKAEPPVSNTSSIKLESAKGSQIEDPDTELNVSEELTSNMTLVKMPKLDHSLVASEFPNNIISDILNQSGDSLLFQALNDNSSKIDSFEFDETTLLSEGGHIATLQEVSTIGFELLIDSETRQNLILTELLSSQSNLIDDDDDDFPDKGDISFVTVQFSPGNESSLQETTTNEDIAGIPGTTDFDSNEDESETAEFDTEESDVENIENGTDREDKIENTEFGTDEDETEDTKFGTDEDETENTEFEIDGNDIENTESGIDEHEIENIELDTDEDKVENIEFETDEIETENKEFSTDEIKNIHNEFDFSDSVKDANITEVSNTDPKCPDPGWCIFWFLALDTCAKDSHCHGSLICCMIGCSKTCIDANNENKILIKM